MVSVLYLSSIMDLIIICRICGQNVDRNSIQLAITTTTTCAPNRIGYRQLEVCVVVVVVEEPLELITDYYF